MLRGRESGLLVIHITEYGQRVKPRVPNIVTKYDRLASSVEGYSKEPMVNLRR